MIAKNTVGLIVINVVLVAIIGWFSFNILLPFRAERFDFIPRWVGSRAIWSGETPYTDDVTTQIQVEMFGSKLPPDADQQRMAYPAYVAWLIAPLLLLPAPLAIAIWTAIQFVSILWLPVLWASLLNWRLPGGLMAVLTFLMLVAFRYPINVFVLGQFTGTMVLLISLGVWCLLHDHDILAGLLFAFATIPPTVSAPLALLILVVYALHHRWKAIAAFIVCLGLLIGATIVQIGWWIPDFLKGIVAYTGYSHPVWPPQLVKSPILSIVIILVVLSLAGWLIIRLLISKRQSFSTETQLKWVISAILICLLLVPQTGNYYLLFMLPPLIACLYYGRTLPRPWRTLVRLFCLFTIVSPWLYFELGPTIAPLETLIIPLSIFILWCGLNWRLDQHQSIEVAMVIAPRSNPPELTPAS